MLNNLTQISRPLLISARTAQRVSAAIQEAACRGADPLAAERAVLYQQFSRQDLPTASVHISGIFNFQKR